MLEIVLADVAKQLLHPWKLDYTDATPGRGRIGGGKALSHVARQFAGNVIRAHAEKRHRARLDATLQGSPGLVRRKDSHQDLVGIHPCGLGIEVSGEIRAVKENALVV